MKKSSLLGAVCAYLAIVSLNSNAATFDNFTVISGSEIIQGNSVSHTIINDLTIDGRWFLSSTGSSTDMIFNGTQTLGGTGELIMSDNINNRLLGDNSSTLTVDADLTIRGAGKTLNLLDLINNGSILAQGTNDKLLIQTSTLTNNGTLRAEGAGGLHLSGVNVNNNTSVDVDAGSSLELSSNAVINGVINVAGAGTASASQTTFDGVTLNGDMQHNNFTSNAVINGLTLNGAWNLNSTSGTTSLNFNGTQSIGGVGEIVMSDHVGNRVSGNGSSLTIGSDAVVRGAGEIGRNISNIVNDGQILAQGTVNELLVRSVSLTNDGVLRAEGAGGLRIQGTNVANNTSVDVNAGSSLKLSSNAVINGTINVVSTGIASADQTTFDGVTLNGDMQHGNSDSNAVTNGLTLNGAWNMNSTGGTTSLNFNGTQSIGGVGEIVMSDHVGNRILGNSNELTVGVGTAIRGSGKVGINVGSINNGGSIRAQGVDEELQIQSNSLSNSGLLSAEGIKGMNITSVSFTTNGLVEVAPTSVLNRTGDFIQTGGTTNVDGTLSVSGLIDILGGSLTGKGAINGTVRNSGTVGPGNSPGQLIVDGDYSQLASGTLDVELGGLIAGTEYDVLNITGIASLEGRLDVDLFDLGDGLFAPSLGDSFDILLAETISGSFDTLLLATLGGGLSLDISYLTDEIGSTDVIRLSVVSAVPLPAAVWLFGSGLLGLFGLSRRKIAA